MPVSWMVKPVSNELNQFRKVLQNRLDMGPPMCTYHAGRRTSVTPHGGFVKAEDLG